jgi:glycosyltransferase involved in cell wall biosynthesis
LGDTDTEVKQKYQIFVQQRAEELGLSQDIYWLGWQENACAWIAAADIVILPTAQHGIFSYPDGERVQLSCTEGFPRIILEAMAAGKPVIASDVAGVREAVVHGETGYIIPPSNPRAIQEALSILVNNHELRICMGQQARQRAAFFSVDRAVMETVKFYEDVLCGRLKGTFCKGTPELFGER